MKRLHLNVNLNRLRPISLFNIRTAIIENSNSVLLNSLFICGLLIGASLYSGKFISYSGIDLKTIPEPLILTIVSFIISTLIFIFSLILGLSYIGGIFTLLLSLISGVLFSIFLCLLTLYNAINRITVYYLIIIPTVGLLAALHVQTFLISQKMSYILTKRFSAGDSGVVSKNISNYIKLFLCYFSLSLPLFITIFFITQHTAK